MDQEKAADRKRRVTIRDVAKAADGAFAHDFALTLIPAWRQANRLASTRVDGLIVSDPTRGDPTLDLLPQLDIPIVTCERDLTPGADYASAVAQGEIRLP